VNYVKKYDTDLANFLHHVTNAENGQISVCVFFAILHIIMA